MVNLFWTGGWDSTFRLLEVVILQHKEVQPFYIIDPIRMSAGFELRAMQRIKKQLFEEYPETKELVLPTRYQELSSVPEISQLHECFYRLREEVPLGEQYKWLAYFADSQNLRQLEVSSHPSTGVTNEFLDKFMREIESEGELNYEIDQKYSGTDVYEVFKYFRFPVFRRSKIRMHEIAQEHGFDHLLKHTWFCHHPTSKGIPCGGCIPCVVTLEDGLKHRFPRSSRIRYTFRKILFRDRFREAFPFLYKVLRSLKGAVKSKTG